MSQWLNNWQNAIGKLKPKPNSPEESLPPPKTPTALLYPTVRTTAALPLPLSPHQIAVDVDEANLFYQSLDGKIVSCCLIFGDIQWQSADLGYPLRVTDQILWAVQGDAIAAYSTTDGQLLMRSHPVELAGEVTHSICDLSAQTLRIDSYSYHPWLGGTPGPSSESAATHQISLITGETLELYQMSGSVSSPELMDRHDRYDGHLKPEERVYPSISDETLQAILAHNESLQMLIGNCSSAQLQTVSIIVHREITANGTLKSTLSVFDPEPPYGKCWDVLIKEVDLGPPHPGYC
uniref:hypothetical protein n=1 Tax=Trichocoleus desertorum TaxID=1481672 RepID=UPI0025B3FCD1|nr:hypothetical protein [Trichocoleus desertorum]